MSEITSTESTRALAAYTERKRTNTMTTTANKIRIEKNAMIARILKNDTYTHESELYKKAANALHRLSHDALSALDVITTMVDEQPDEQDDYKGPSHGESKPEGSTAKIRNSDMFAIGTRRCTWTDDNEDWNVRISINKNLGRLRLTAGNKDHETTWMVEGYDLRTLASYLEFVIGVVGDEHRIREAFAHLIRCQWTDDEIKAAETCGLVVTNTGAILQRWRPARHIKPVLRKISQIGRATTEEAEQEARND